MELRDCGIADLRNCEMRFAESGIHLTIEKAVFR